ncbi:hypothetical protein ACTFIY_002604 [Dictyostelium cf. discoideum]
MDRELQPAPTITTVPDEWFESLLRHEGISTLNNVSEMKDLNIPDDKRVLSKHHIAKVFLNDTLQIQVNFPSPKVKVFVIYLEDGKLTLFLHRQLEPSETLNVMKKHINNTDAIKV